jgi:hypothetical protein
MITYIVPKLVVESDSRNVLRKTKVANGFEDYPSLFFYASEKHKYWVQRYK